MSGNCVATDVFDRADLLEEILVRVPPQFISNSTLVSKSWLGLTRRSSFLEHYTRRWSHEVKQLQHRLHSQQLAAVDQLYHRLQSLRLAMAERVCDRLRSQQLDAMYLLSNSSRTRQLEALEEKLNSQQSELVNELQHQLQSEQLAAVNELQPQSRQLATMNELQQLVEADQSQQLAAANPPQHLIAVQLQLRSQLLVAVNQLQHQHQSQLRAMEIRLLTPLLFQVLDAFGMMNLASTSYELDDQEWVFGQATFELRHQDQE